MALAVVLSPLAHGSFTRDVAFVVCRPPGQRPVCWRKKFSSFAQSGGSSNNMTPVEGLYKKFADHAWDRLTSSGWFQDAELPSELSENVAAAKGASSPDTVVRISVKAMKPTESKKDLIRYARVALLETVSPTSRDLVQSAGIQVLNFVVFPSQTTNLPVLGIDLVSLPGGRHLLLLDAQPMTSSNPFEENWSGWYEKYVVGNESVLPWGGDFPEPVQKYVSKYSLWTRLQDIDDPISIIENQVWDAFVSHLDVYLSLLSQPENFDGPNHQVDYLDYRKNNDPAKPMLNSLYGAEWTDRVLDEVLFPQNC